MKIQQIRTPKLGTNDSTAQLVQWFAEAGSQVSSGAMLCELETTKATLEVVSPGQGFLFPLVEPGSTVEEGLPLAVLTDDENYDVATWSRESTAKITGSTLEPTRKAQLLLERHGLEATDLPAPLGPRLSEADVEAFLREQSSTKNRIGLGLTSRLAILGGVSGGGALIVIDAARRMSDIVPAAIYDHNPAYKGQHILGVPILGSVEDRLDRDYAEGVFDCLVIAFNRDLSARHTLFMDMVERGYRFINVVDPSVDLRSGVELGSGNVVLGHSYIGACSKIGDNNFLSAGVSIEHGNLLGDSCSFGPGVFTSGNVTIGDRVRLGTGIHIEPGLEVGSDAVIGSGQTLVSSVEAGKLLTSRAKG